MKICFINPPSTFELIGNDPVIIKDQQGTYPPLGLLSIAGYLLSLNKGYEVTCIDAQVDDLTHQEVAQKVASINPDIIGITVMTFTLIDCKRAIDEIRKVTNAVIVAGGPHVAIYPEETLEGLGVDYVVVGEGEYTFAKLLEDIENNTVDSRVYKQDHFITDLDNLPFPARELTPINKYYSVLAESTPTTTAFTSRGCPFHCTYCDRPALGKKFRYQSANRVVDEMQWCEEHGIKEIFFYDDTFTVNKKRVHEICEEYGRRSLTIKWDIRARVNTVDQGLLEAIKRANCTRVHFGVESAVPRILSEINKGITPAQVYSAFDICHKLGIKTLAYFMMGNPTETLYDIKESLKMAIKIKADFTQITITSLFPATEMYRQAQEKGIVKGDPWRDYAIKPDPKFKPPTWNEIYEYEELEEILRWFYKKFYLRPEFIWDRIMEVRSPGQFLRYAKGGLSLLKMSVQKESKRKLATNVINKVG